MKSNHKGEMCWVPLSSLKYVFRVFKIIHLSIFDWLAGFITGTSPTWLQPSKALCGGYSEATLRLTQQFSYRSLHLHFCLLYPCFKDYHQGSTAPSWKTRTLLLPCTNSTMTFCSMQWNANGLQYILIPLSPGPLHFSLLSRNNHPLLLYPHAFYTSAIPNY